MDAGPLKRLLKKEGATLAGVGDVTGALTKEISHLNRGISLAVNRGLNQDTVELLMRLQKAAERWLKERGFRSLSIPPDSDRRKGKCISRLYKLFSHKTAATCSGLGWVGKNGLIINRRYGSKLTWATVLTDAPFDPDEPVTESRCGVCSLCMQYCPSGAVSGAAWSRKDPLKELVNYEKCRSLKGTRRHFAGKPNCGLCITICPYSRKNVKDSPQRAQRLLKSPP